MPAGARAQAEKATWYMHICNPKPAVFAIAPRLCMRSMEVDVTGRLSSRGVAVPGGIVLTTIPVFIFTGGYQTSTACLGGQ